jgi:wobble nucleotide-excising tRNase
MIKEINLIRNIGCFDSFAGSSLGDLKKLVLIYAENGRGKTTISSILSSLANNDATLINGRKRLGSSNDPHIILRIEGENSNTIFQSGNWNASLDYIYVYDDEFINQNVFSGLEISASHRQKLHEIVLGRAGVSLARQVQELTEKITICNSRIRDISNLIPTDKRFGLEIDVFCNLREISNIEQLIVDKQRVYDAISQADAISKKNLFTQIPFPEINADTLKTTLSAGLPDLDESAMRSIYQHFSLIGENAETWISNGTDRIISTDTGQEQCPFCGQNIDGIDLISKYRSYFGESYRRLNQNISSQISQYTNNFSGDNLSSKQEEISNLINHYGFWGKFVELPEISIDWHAISTAWQEARDGILSLLRTKRLSPLNPINLTDEIDAKIEKYLSLIEDVTKNIDTMIGFNEKINELKEQADSQNLIDVTNELNTLKAIQSRYSDELKELCDQYQTEVEHKTNYENQKGAAREALDNHRLTVFNRYFTAINAHLELFGANFRIGGMESSNAAGRPSTTYHIVINDYHVPLVSDVIAPCFKNALSAGDRNTLGLAFFFASLENESRLNNSIIALDDPISSLDDGRTTTTIQKIRDLLSRSKQVLILCHVRGFLCDIWEHSDKNNTTALKITRGANNTSDITTWDVSSDAFTEYDKRHKALRDYVEADTQDKRYVAQCLRLVMEKYLRITCPEYCTPGTLLGNFLNQVETLFSSGQPIMNDVEMRELRDITGYANKFHHDTNPAWEIEQINDNELLGFVRRVLNFIKPGTT